MSSILRIPIGRLLVAGTRASVLLSGLLLPLAVPAQDTISVRVRAFHDLNGDGTRDEGEPGLPAVRFTNGVAVFETDDQGGVDLLVDRDAYRFSTMTIPAGWWPTSPWYHWVPVGTAGPDTADFGLAIHAPTETDPVRWVHITDTQVKTWGDPQRLDLDLAEINELASPPAFVINTGDLVQRGSDSTHWNNYLAQLAVSDFPVFNVVGNHDTVGTASPLDNYEERVGPPYYSLEIGSWHLMIYNSENPAVATPMQDTWWHADLAAAPPGSHFAMYQHRLLKESSPETVAGWAADGILASFSGHWHALQFSDRPEGIAEYNLSRTRAGPLDRTPRVFGLVTFRSDGSIDYEMRRLSVDHRTEITVPPDGRTIGGDLLEVLVQAYDTSSLVWSLRATVSGAGGSAGPAALAREGISLWRGSVDVSALPDGDYDVTVRGGFADGAPVLVTSSFTRSEVEPISRQPVADWPMFRRSVAGSSFVAQALSPPLELAWARPLAGLVGLNSPVVAGSRVYVGARAENELGQGGVAAYDALTGGPVWFTHVPSGVALAPAVAGNVVVVTAMSDSIYGIDAASGGILWSTRSRVSRYHLTAPVVEGDVAWVGGEPYPMQIRWSNGVIDWESGYLGSDWFPYTYSAPAVGESHVYFGFYGDSSPDQGGLAVVERATGAVETVDEGAYRSPIWTGTVLYVVGAAERSDQRLTARDALGNVTWTSPVTIGRGTGSPALGHGVVVVAGRDGTIEGLDAGNGAGLWSHSVGPALFDMVPGQRDEPGTMATPAITDSVVWIGSLDGFLYALDLATGGERWRRYLGTPIASSAAVSGNMLFVCASDGHLYAFESATETSTGVAAQGGDATVFSFYRPRPNPGTTATRLAWTMPSRADVRLAIYDVRGRHVRTLVREEKEAGEQVVVWDGRGDDGRPVASGVYFARLAAGKRTAVRKLVRLAR